MKYVLSLVFIVGLVVLIFVGYIKNIVKLAHTDFEKPYKAEILRGVGIIMPPVGVVEGYINISDK